MTCEWSLDETGWYVHYNTGCGEAFIFNEERRGDEFKYCPYCGQEITERSEQEGE